jgi:hypothetical protein
MVSFSFVVLNEEQQQRLLRFEGEDCFIHDWDTARRDAFKIGTETLHVRKHSRSSLANFHKTTIFATRKDDDDGDDESLLYLSTTPFISVVAVC